MLVTTEGIVLHTIKYSESSVIAHIYTKDYGIGSYLMNGVRNKRSKMAYFQAFSHVNIVAYRKETNSIHRIKEIRFSSVRINIQSDIIKQSIAQFLGEVLFRVIHKEDRSPELFNFMNSEIEVLEQSSMTNQNFHIYFLIKLMAFFGIEPHNNFSTEATIFNVEMGEFANLGTEACLSKELSFVLHSLLNDLSSKVQNTKVLKSDRSAILDVILHYFRVHTHEFGRINSLDIFKAVFS